MKQKKRTRRLYMTGYALTPQKRIDQSAVLCEDSSILAIGGLDVFFGQSLPFAEGGNEGGKRPFKGLGHKFIQFCLLDLILGEQRSNDFILNL